MNYAYRVLAVRRNVDPVEIIVLDVFHAREISGRGDKYAYFEADDLALMRRRRRPGTTTARTGASSWPAA